MGKFIEHDHSSDGIDRRGFLKCMAWVGTGLVWSMHGGILSSRSLSAAAATLDPTSKKPAPSVADFTFAQVSDSHIGFSKEPNHDVIGTFQAAVDRLNALDVRPDLVLHTGDLTHLSKPEEFDTVSQIIKQVRTGQAFYCPGEHDFFSDDGKAYLERHGQGTLGTGWQSFTHKGVHFVGLVNVANLQPGGLGMLGREQLDWLKSDLAALPADTPIVIFAHVPLWMVYPKWGWGTADSEEALSYLKRFGSATILNGHIHQVLQKIEGNITFHTACSTAFPQPAPGTAASPGPIKNVAADRLRSLLGLTRVDYTQHPTTLAIVDSTLQ